MWLKRLSKDTEWIPKRTDAGAEIFCREHFNGKVGVDLANDLGGVVVCEVGFLKLVSGEFVSRCEMLPYSAGKAQAIESALEREHLRDSIRQ